MEEAFKPLFNLTKTMTRNLLRIEATKTQIIDLPMTAAVLTGLRESARLFSTHYSTMIEGNKLNPEQIAAVITENKTFVGRERDAKEVAGYYQALTLVEKKAQSRTPLTEKFIQEIHSIVMSDGVEKTKPTPTEQQLLRSLTPMQRKVLLIFHKSKIVTTQEIERKLKLNRRTILLYCKEWVANGFIEIVDPSNKNRSYQLTPAYEALLVAAL